MAKAEKQSRTSLWESITARVIDELESGTVPWKRSWTGPNGMPRNGVSGKPYRGCNVLLTILTAMSRGYDDPRWYSFRQANLIAEKAARAAGRDTIQDSRGVWCYEDTKQAHPKKSKQKGFRYESCGGVKKGQNRENDTGGTQVVWWSKINIKAKQDDEAEPNEETDGKIGRSAWIIKPFTVFNAEQLDDHVREYLGTVTGIEGLEHEPDATAEAVLAGYDHKVKFGGNQPCYSPKEDRIRMPELKYFNSSDEYYSTYFHEAGHSTGHPSKLNRKGVAEFNGARSHVYADEELVAELTACLLCGYTGIARDETVANSAAYLRSWISKLKDDPKIIVYAAQRAQKAADFILGETPQYEDDRVEKVA